MSALCTKPSIYPDAPFVCQKIAGVEISTAGLVSPAKDSHLHAVRNHARKEMWLRALGSHSPVYPCGIRHNGQCSHFENPENAPSGYAKYSPLTTRIYIHILLVRPKFYKISKPCLNDS